MSYLDNSNYSSLDKDELEDSGILGNFIYQTIFSLVHIHYLNTCKSIKKSPHFLEICLSDWKYIRPDLF